MQPTPAGWRGGGVPPDSADVEMEEAAGGEPGQQPAKKATSARKPPRRRRLYSRNARNGVDTKIGSSELLSPELLLPLI